MPKGHGRRKLGLGSSAAVCAAAYAVTRRASGADLLDTDADRERNYADVDAAHGRAQGEKGSGADLAAAVWGGTLCFARGASGARIEFVRLPDDLDVLLVDTGSAASTGERVGRLRALRETDPARHAALLRPLAEISMAVIDG